MRVIRPGWAVHEVGDHDRKKRQAIFTLDVHPDGSRLATGGIDAIIRVWTTAPIRNEKLESNERVPKQLSTLDQHSGPVLSVRWSNSGRYLASSSDDRAIIIWAIDPNGGGKVFGSTEVNIEGWKAERVLSGHDSDVTEIAWSKDDRYLASVAMDGCFMVHDTQTFERIIKISGHDSSIKGLGFDPSGHFLATASDDRSLKIWRTSDWGLQASITDPFEDSPRAFVRRLSWCPDGANVICANAITDSVFVAAVVKRSDWSSQMKLVGHENSVLCTAFNPRMYKDGENGMYNICATGSTDSVISIWKMNTSKPLIVIKDIFERQVLDLSWSRDGNTLYSCSADGSIIALSFSQEELGQPVADQEISNILINYEKPVAPAFPIMPIQQVRPTLQKEPSQLEKLMENKRAAPTANEPSKKKRIAPTLVEKLPGIPDTPSNPFNPPVPGPSTSAYPPQPVYYPSANIPSQTFNPPQLPSNMLMPMTLPHPQNPNVVGYWLPYIKNPDEEEEGGDDEDTPMEIEEMDPSRVKISNIPSGLLYKNVKARTLGHGVKREEVEVKDIGEVRRITKDVTIGVPTIKSVLFHQFMGAATVGNKELDRVEVRNAITDDKNDVEMNNGSEDIPRKYPDLHNEILMLSKRSDTNVSNHGKVIWVDYASSRVVNVSVGDNFVGVSLEDGTLRIYSFSGRRIFPDITLDSTCSFLEAEATKLLAITCSGSVYVYCTKTRKILFEKTSLKPLLNASDITINSVRLRSNGVPVVILSNGTAHAYDFNQFRSWTLISSTRFVKSDAWDRRGRQRQSSSSAAQSTQSQHHYQQQQSNPISSIEIKLNELLVDEKISEPINTDKDSMEEEEAVYTLSHLETRLHGAILLDSPTEFRNSMIAYARRLGDEGFRGKAEEFMKEYMGPIFYNHNRGEEFTPTVLGYKKRDLVKEFANTLAKSKPLAKLGQEYLDLLKQINSEIV
ncbi:WD40 repeat-like protein [Wallemia mellicola]|nr:WD40 repeat-like protein [Wallemia mellicola]